MLLWGALTWMGSDLIRGVKSQNAIGYPNDAQIAWFIGAPLTMAGAATVALVVWHQTRYKHLALAFQILGLAVTFPYLCTWSGGV